MDNPVYCSITININWLEEIDLPVTSMSFVLMEKNKNCWHAIGGKDQHILFRPNCEPANKGMNVVGLPKSGTKMGD